MKFLVDENLPSEVAEQLREAGHDATTAFELGLIGQADLQIAAVCRRDRRALISLDLDFANTLVYPPADYFGLVILRPRAAEQAECARGHRGADGEAVRGRARREVVDRG